MMLINEQ
jgi:hypothetical protein